MTNDQNEEEDSVTDVLRENKRKIGAVIVVVLLLLFGAFLFIGDNPLQTSNGDTNDNTGGVTTPTETPTDGGTETPNDTVDNTGSLVVESVYDQRTGDELSSSSLSVNSEEFNKGESKELAEEEYTITVNSEGYVEKQVTVTVESGKTTTVSVGLEPQKDFSTYPSYQDCESPKHELLGEGTENNPYKILNVYDLQCMDHYSNSAHYELANDIDATHTQNWEDNAVGEDGFKPLAFADFRGNFDGNGHTINGLYIEDKTARSTKLGIYQHNYGTIENVGLTNVNVVGQNDYVGGLSGTNFGTIKNVYVSGTVTDTDLSQANGGIVGGVVAANGADGVVKNSYSVVEVGNNGKETGALVGSNRGFTTDSYWNTDNNSEGVGINLTASEDERTTENVVGLTTSEMQGSSAESNMSALNWTDVWMTTDSYPELQK